MYGTVNNTVIHADYATPHTSHKYISKAELKTLFSSKLFYEFCISGILYSVVHNMARPGFNI
jgi:hypothetical protein